MAHRHASLHPQRLRGGGTAEQADYKEEEVVKFIGTQRRTKEFKLIEDNGSAPRQTPLWFCTECGNMLYPKEGVATRTLRRICRVCKREDDADTQLVYVNDLRPNAKAADAGADMAKDPTLPHATGVECEGCGHDEAVFFQAPMKGDQAMQLIFMCIKCAHRWLQ